MKIYFAKIAKTLQPKNTTLDSTYSKSILNRYLQKIFYSVLKMAFLLLLPNSFLIKICKTNKIAAAANKLTRIFHIQSLQFDMRFEIDHHWSMDSNSNGTPQNCGFGVSKNIRILKLNHPSGHGD